MNVENRHGDTAVHLAIKANNVEAVRMLLPKCGEEFPRKGCEAFMMLIFAYIQGGMVGADMET